MLIVLWVILGADGAVSGYCVLIVLWVILGADGAMRGIVC